MRIRFDEQLETLNKDMITMGMLCEKSIEDSVKALIKDDNRFADTVPELLIEIKQMEREIESYCLKLLLQQQPVAKDLRVISSALKIITDMGRIGTQSSDIAEILKTIEKKQFDNLDYLEDMSKSVIKMVRESIDAFVNKDIELAKKVIQYDDVVDEEFDNVKKSLIKRLQEEMTAGSYILDLLMIAKYFERIGDHAVNIAKWVVFSITGKREKSE